MKYPDPGPDDFTSQPKNILRFGKHTGKRVEDVPIDYLRWMVKCHSWQSKAAWDELERRKKENTV